LGISTEKVIHGINGKGYTCGSQVIRTQPVVGVVCRVWRDGQVG